MKSTRKITAIFAATAALSLLAATSASAEERHRDGTWRDNGSYRDNRGDYRDHRGDNRDYRRDNDGYRHETRNDRFNEHGRISRFTHERDGYRVWLDRDDRRSYWVPSYRLGGHRLRVGLDLRLGGAYNGGYWEVDTLGYPGAPYYNEPYYGNGYYNNGYLSGRVERVNPRYGTLLLRNDRSGRLIEVDMRATDRRGGLDFDDLRPGAFVTLSGSWGGGAFHAYRIDGARPY